MSTLGYFVIQLGLGFEGRKDAFALDFKRVNWKKIIYQLKLRPDLLISVLFFFYNISNFLTRLNFFRWSFRCLHPKKRKLYFLSIIHPLSSNITKHKNNWKVKQLLSINPISCILPTGKDKKSIFSIINPSSSILCHLT